ncbi:MULTISPECIES: type I-E CRISPR-associated protein Cse2/CasB [Halomonadaceae]|uniref:type I-E CRISPR-associated protein Cse2/CasB n=1 Tax=Halomonadaceae TaxID=28256 RepID=UPI001583B0A9|nr:MULTISPECIES: type I-E CRISPR-associated protein Cse2/CasB [Halomonas]MDI4638812.1 type I-E CRISPR-associated protein Cse2/CasB [Halomonas sp. BMC7]NUJ59800.1 type I-E CRISPR-associated protein Cse2/CasB [Halomonas taeanensis]
MSQSETPEMADTPSSEKKVPERLLALSPGEAFKVRVWWQHLTLSPQELATHTKAPPWPKGMRARLRRCESTEAAMLSEGFRHLWQSLPEQPTQYRDERLQQWSCIALVLAEVRAETPSASLGSRLGQEKNGTGKPCMSELRFQQLMDCHSPQELVQRLRRALALIDKRDISVVHLADNIALWWREYRGRLHAEPSKRLGFVWANDYFDALAKYQRDSD